MRLSATFAFLLMFCLCSLQLQAQSRIQIEQADSLLGGRNAAGEAFRKLVGKVILVQGSTRIFGDSVILYSQKNVTEVFGKTVRVEEGDSIVVTGKSLVYDGNTKLARMRRNVVYKDPSMTLYTDILNYDIPKNFAYYYDHGRLVDTTNVLTSIQGSYNTVSHLAAFKDSVVLVNPDYTLKSDTLEYNTVSKIAYTQGPTEIISEDGSILNAEKGSEYKTAEEQSVFGLGTVETEKYIIKADQLFVDNKSKRYNASHHVEMISKDNEIIITGDSAYYLENEGLTKVYGNPVMKKVMSPDTLYLSADTLISIEDSIPENDRILAYYDVRIYRDDLQGISDSLAYHVHDSVLYFFDDPVLWNQSSQITADSINVEIKDQQIDKLNAHVNSFVISQDTINNFNQVKGITMEAYFKDNNLNKIDVFGNGESVYYALQQDTITVGMNKILCSNMMIEFAQNQVNKIHTYVKPEASFIPPHEITDETSRLQNFKWRDDEKPTKAEVLNRDTAPEKKRPVIPDYPVVPLNTQEKKAPKLP